MNSLTVLFVLAGAVLSSVSGHAIPQNCSARYQSALREALDIKEECGDAAPYDCCQILNTVQLMNTADDLYKIKSGVNFIGQICSNNQYPFLAHNVPRELKARCDMETDEGGWLVIQRRVSGGRENFARGWIDYENGFGDLNGEFWYGLENIHCLTARDDVELRIDLKKDDGTTNTWTYQLFKVAGESANYRLTIGQGEGTTTDFMAYHNNRPFTTRDRDNDGYSGGNCADIVGNEGGMGGGWWFWNCGHSVFTRISKPRVYNAYGHNWVEYDAAEMKIRPKSCFRQKASECN